jgi:DUF1680 family protein
MRQTFRLLPDRSVELLRRLLQNRLDVSRNYVLSLKTANLPENHYLEADLWAPMGKPADAHWGWESPTYQIRGEFLGHWLSASAHMYATTGDQELKGEAAFIASEVARCQQENGGEWAGAIPERYVHWPARRNSAWVPQCTVHRNMMGLVGVRRLPVCLPV